MAACHCTSHLAVGLSFRFFVIATRGTLLRHFHYEESTSLPDKPVSCHTKRRVHYWPIACAGRAGIKTTARGGVLVCSRILAELQSHPLRPAPASLVSCNLD